MPNKSNKKTSKKNSNTDFEGDKQIEDLTYANDPVTALRGSSIDWSFDNSDNILEKQKRYSKNILMQQQSGSIDFDSMISEQS